MASEGFTDETAGSTGLPWLRVVGAALLLTALNVAKPVHIDDPAYLTYAAEFAEHPLAPYDFYFGTPVTVRGNGILVPPVVPYWLAAGIHVAGDDPALLKLWLLPFALLLAAAVDALAARFAPSLRGPVFWLCVFSPAVVPGFNFMLDVPVLALGLAALVLAMRSADGGSWATAVAAGLVGGLAVQAKYTGLVPCAAAFVWCALRGRPVRGVVVAGLAIGVAVGWEYLLVRTQGESHFLVHLGQRQGRPLTRAARLLLPLLSHVAGLAPAVALLALRALGWSGRAVAAVALLAAAGVALLGVVPSQEALVGRSDGKAVLTASNLVYGVLAVPVWASLGGVALALLARRRSEAGGDHRAAGLFLVAWLLLEAGGYFALSPFPASRRVAGFVLVFALAAGRLAHLRGVGRRAAAGAAFAGAALTLLLTFTDLVEAGAHETAADRVAHGAHAPAPGCTYWFTGLCGFGYYAERDGLKPLRIDRELPKPGDLIAVLDDCGFRTDAATGPGRKLELIDTVGVSDAFPFRTCPGYYSGRTPLEHRGAVRVRVFVYRVVAVPVGKA